VQSPLRSATKAVVPPQPVVADSESVQVAADSGLASALVGSQPVETDSDWRDWLRPAARKEAGVPLPMTVAEFEGFVQKQIELNAKIVKAAGYQPQ